MASRKLQRKIWVLSLATTMISIGIMMYIPTLYFQVLPILIPSSIITVIMPTYFLEPNKSTNKENETKNTNNTISENSIKIKKEKQIEKSKDIIDEISEDETLSLKEKKEMLQILRQEKINNNTKAKPKQNLKT
ncbi:hypothetical protein EGW03_05585 [bacterium]|nr:hypothetical protein [bacterium]